MLLRRTLQKNFGDDLNTFLIKHISGINPKEVNFQFKNLKNELIYMAIGSVMGWADRNTIIWGTGFISSNSKVKEPPKKICAVRGKLTRAKLLKLGIDCPEIYGDPCLLYPKFYNPTIKKKYKLGIVPHYVDKDSIYLETVRNEKNILIIDIQDDVHKVIDNIRSCDRIASSCLHGIICADAYKIPSIWIKLSNKVLGNGFKFEDYFSGVGRTENPLIMMAGINIKNIMEKFTEYNIVIDLDTLYKVCPFKEINENQHINTDI